MKAEYLPVSAVADYLGVTRKHIYHLIALGKLPAVRLGLRQTRIPRQSVETLLASLSRLHVETLGLDPAERLATPDRAATAVAAPRPRSKKDKRPSPRPHTKTTKQFR